jgi:hypothetical protein
MLGGSAYCKVVALRVLLCSGGAALQRRLGFLKAPVNIFWHQSRRRAAPENSSVGWLCDMIFLPDVLTDKAGRETDYSSFRAWEVG